MFEQTFKNIDDILWKEAGCTTELDYTEQTSWLLFLKYLDGLEQDRADVAALEEKKYTYILDKPYRWETWAAPKGKNGKLDHNQAMTGDDLRDFVNLKLFPYLHSFTQKATGANTTLLPMLWLILEGRKRSARCFSASRNIFIRNGQWHKAWQQERANEMVWL